MIFAALFWNKISFDLRILAILKMKTVKIFPLIKNNLLIAALIFSLSCKEDQIGFPEHVFVGDTTLLTQNDILLFAQNNYTHIVGSLTIGHSSQIWSEEKITTLKPLISLEEVDNLEITADQLENLSGLNNLKKAGHLVIGGSFSSLDGLEKLTSIEGGDGLNIVGRQLQNINGLKNLKKVEGDLSFSWIESLVTLDGLRNLEEVTGNLEIGFEFSDKNNLISLNGLENLKSIGQRFILINSAQISILYGLRNLEDLGGIQIIGNAELKDYCDIKNLLGEMIDQESSFIVEDNLYNPTVDEIISGFEKCGI